MSKEYDSKGQVRCLNCFTRFTPELNAVKASCPECGTEWRVVWSSPNFVKVRGPVWDKLKLKRAKT